MNVYILFEAWQYEGEDIIAVYATREAAEAEANLRSDDPDGYYTGRRSFIVREFPLLAQ